MIFAHRGASGYYCENTRSAFRYAYELGCRHVEIDCQLCGDGEMIVFHDDDLSRLAGVDIAPPHSDLKTLQMQDLHFSYNDKPRPAEKILSLVEFVSLAREYGFQVNFEIKAGLGDGIANGVALAEILNSHYANEPTPIISSFDFTALEACRKALRLPCEYALLSETWESSLIDLADSHGATALHFRLGAVSAEQVAHVLEHNLSVRIYTVNDKTQADELFSWGVQAVFTDFPDKLHD